MNPRIQRQPTKQLSQLNTDNPGGFYLAGVHYDHESEGAIIGVCLMERDGFARTVGLLEPEHFHDDLCREVYDSMQKMYANGDVVDLITVTHHMRKKGYTEWNGQLVAYPLSQLCMGVVSSAHIESWSVIIRELYVDREMIRIRREVPSGDALAQAQQIQAALSKAMNLKAEDDWVDMSQTMLSLANHRDAVKGKSLMGVPTGFKTLDRITYGFQPTQLIVIGARPSVGKTALASGIALEVAKQGFKVGIVSLEMPEEQIGGRLAAVYADMEFWRVYRNRHTDADEEKRLMDGMANLAGLPISLSSKTNVTGTAIRAKADKLLRRGKLDLLIIDYLQLIEGEDKSSNREREIAKLSRTLKLMAMDMKIPVIVLCQLNRESEKQGSSKKPRMSQIRESGAIEQDADIVMLLHRDWKSGIQKTETGESTEKMADLIVEKNRNGETTTIPISFEPETMKFYEADESAWFTAPNSIEHAPAFSPALVQAGRATTNDKQDLPF